MGLHEWLDTSEGSSVVESAASARDVVLLRRLWEQIYLKRTDYITCPLPYLEKLYLLNYSLNTICTYHSLLLRFFNGQREQGMELINSFGTQEINEYHRQMVQSQKYSFSLINQAINAVKFYFHRVLGRHTIDLSQIERPEKPSRLPAVLSKEEVQRICKPLIT